MTQASADLIIKSEVKAIIARREPLNRLLDDHVRANLIQQHPAILKFLPRHVETIWSTYVVPIDFEAKEEMRRLIAKQPGLINIGMDGATVSGSQKVSLNEYYTSNVSHSTFTLFPVRRYQILYTIAKGSFSCALTFTDLMSEKHQTHAEINDAIRVCDECMNDNSCRISSIAVDNAARGVAKKVADHYQHKDNMKIVVSRDPSHTVDLLSKDIAKTEVVKAVVAECKEIHTMVRDDRINSMRIDAVQLGYLTESFAGQTLCETRMNEVHGYLDAGIKQFGFLTSLPRNAQWKEFLETRKPDVRDKLLETLNRNIDNSR